MTSTTCFHLFSSLPPELRWMIWSLNLPAPRLVSLHYTPSTSHPAHKSLLGSTSATPIPANLHVNKESRCHALQHYTLSFNLPYCAPKIWFDTRRDVLYFPAKEGWQGSWNHFVNALSMMVPAELGNVRRLAVHEALITGLRGASSSPIVRAACVREFWEYVRKKFEGVEEVVVLLERQSQQDNVRIWIEGVLGFVFECGFEVDCESPEQRLRDGLEKGLRFVEESSGWKPTRWDVLRFPRDKSGSGTGGWPEELLKGHCCDIANKRSR